jgi:hypothetical protein
VRCGGGSGGGGGGGGGAKNADALMAVVVGGDAAATNAFMCALDASTRSRIPAHAGVIADGDGDAAADDGVWHCSHHDLLAWARCTCRDSVFVFFVALICHVCLFTRACVFACLLVCMYQDSRSFCNSLRFNTYPILSIYGADAFGETQILQSAMTRSQLIHTSLRVVYIDA